MTVPCWRVRHEALGYAEVVDALIALTEEELDRLAVESGREAKEDEQGYCGYRYDVLNDLCMEPEGHTGACRFVPEDRVVLTFSPDGRVDATEARL